MSVKVFSDGKDACELVSCNPSEKLEDKIEMLVIFVLLPVAHKLSSLRSEFLYTLQHVKGTCLLAREL